MCVFFAKKEHQTLLQSNIMFKNLLFFVAIVGCAMAQTPSSPLAKCKGKYFGNITASNVQSNYTANWNQMTMENESKWQSVEGTQGRYNFTGSDRGFDWAKNNGGIFKYHTLMWGAQTPGWVAQASSATLQASIPVYFKAVADHYDALGGLKLIDVLNEPINTAVAANLKNALTAGYQAEPANAADRNNQYGWAIWCFQLARRYFPNATLLINEYNVEMNWNNCRAPYIAMSNAIKNAPNLTDGKKNLIDGIGLQAHGINNLTAANFKACIDEIYTKTGLPLHITEFDATADPNEAKQRDDYARLIPVAWEHPNVAGITLWGFIQGQTWIGGNGQTGANGTDSGIMYANGQDRPAMTWLRNYLAGRPNLSCCPAPAPFASCSSTNTPPTVALTAPLANASFAIGSTITLSATASDLNGTVSKVEFFNGTTLLNSSTGLLYTYAWTNVAEGTYTITAVATDNVGDITTSSPVTIIVGNPKKQLITNGEFDNGTTAWDIQNNNNATGTISVVTNGNLSGTNSLRICPSTNPGTIDWHVQVRQNAPIVSNKNYNISFVAKADVARQISVGIQQEGTPYTFYFIQTINLTTTSQTFNLNFNATVTDATSKLKFLVGANTNCVNIDKVSVEESNFQHPATITAVGATTFCTGGSVVLNANTGLGYAYQWKKNAVNINGATTSSYTANESGSYTVQITANNTIVTSAATTVTINPLPIATISTTTPTTFCAGGNVVLTSSAGSS